MLVIQSLPYAATRCNGLGQCTVLRTRRASGNPRHSKQARATEGGLNRPYAHWIMLFNKSSL